MRHILMAIMLYSSFASASEVAPQANDMKFVTDFTNFACKSFRDKVDAPKELAELEVEFTNLGISSSTRRAIIDVKTLDGECLYSADYSRKKGETILTFENSYMTNTPKCLEVKKNLDEIMSEGFRYRIKYNAFISMLFLKKLSGQCDDVSGNHLIEFQWML